MAEIAKINMPLPAPYFDMTQKLSSYYGGEWRKMHGYNRDYFISDNGLIFSLGKGRLLKKQKHGGGYQMYAMMRDRGTVAKMSLIHRLVAEAFIPNPDNLPQINHLNGNKQDNRVGNLQWCSMSDNVKHSYRELGHKRREGINNLQSKWVVQIDRNGNTIAQYCGIKNASRQTGIEASTITRSCGSDYLRAGGYKWEYKANMSCRK